MVSTMNTLSFWACSYFSFASLNLFREARLFSNSVFLSPKIAFRLLKVQFDVHQRSLALDILDLLVQTRVFHSVDLLEQLRFLAQHGLFQGRIRHPQDWRALFDHCPHFQVDLLHLPAFQRIQVVRLNGHHRAPLGDEFLEGTDGNFGYCDSLGLHVEPGAVVAEYGHIEYQPHKAHDRRDADNALRRQQLLLDLAVHAPGWRLPFRRGSTRIHETGNGLISAYRVRRTLRRLPIGSLPIGRRALAIQPQHASLFLLWFSLFHRLALTTYETLASNSRESISGRFYELPVVPNRSISRLNPWRPLYNQTFSVPAGTCSCSTISS